MTTEELKRALRAMMLSNLDKLMEAKGRIEHHCLGTRVQTLSDVIEMIDNKEMFEEIEKKYEQYLDR